MLVRRSRLSSRRIRRVRQQNATLLLAGAQARGWAGLEGKYSVTFVLGVKAAGTELVEQKAKKAK